MPFGGRTSTTRSSRSPGSQARRHARQAQERQGADDRLPAAGAGARRGPLATRRVRIPQRPREPAGAGLSPLRLAGRESGGGAPEIRWHDLRHFTATQLLEMGLSHFDVSVQLGHEDGGALVMARYGHPSTDRARERLLAPRSASRAPKVVAALVAALELVRMAKPHGGLLDHISRFRKGPPSGPFFFQPARSGLATLVAARRLGGVATQRPAKPFTPVLLAWGSWLGGGGRGGHGTDQSRSDHQRRRCHTSPSHHPSFLRGLAHARRGPTPVPGYGRQRNTARDTGNPAGDVLLRHRLLRQPGGFERLGCSSSSNKGGL